MMKESEKLLSLRLSDLRLVADLSRHRSIRAVARLREVQPSQVSRSIQRVERHWGEKLFRRSQGGVVPLESASHIANFFDRQFENLFSNRESGSREVVIGAPSYLANYLVAAGLSRLIQNYADVDFKIIDIPPESLAREALRGTLDVVVHMDKIEWPRTWETSKIGEMEYGLYGGKRAFNKVKYRSEDVKDLEFIYPVYWINDDLIFGRDYCPLQINKRIRKLGTATAEAAVNALAESDCVSYMPHVVAQGRVKDGSIRRLQVADWPEVNRDVLLSYHSEKVTANFTVALLNELSKILKTS